jgi:hypothetical protein
MNTFVRTHIYMYLYVDNWILGLDYNVTVLKIT